MKKAIIAIVALVVLAGGAALVLNQKNKKDGDLATTGGASYVSVKACDILTGSIAEQTIGNGAVKGTLGAGQTSSDDMVFDTCTYTAGPNADTPHTASVAVRSARNSVGASSNRAMFTASGKPADAQDVSGYGDKAYWDASMAQLNILKGNNWYIVSNYKGTAPSNGTATRTMAEELAKLLKLQ